MEKEIWLDILDCGDVRKYVSVDGYIYRREGGEGVG